MHPLLALPFRARREFPAQAMVQSDKLTHFKPVVVEAGVNPGRKKPSLSRV